MASDAPIGTKIAGYAGPENGPFRCDHCVHYSHDRCDHPKVIEDPSVKKGADGKAIVDDGGCCNFFRSQRPNAIREALVQIAKKESYQRH